MTEYNSGPSTKRGRPRRKKRLTGTKVESNTSVSLKEEMELVRKLMRNNPRKYKNTTSKVVQEAIKTLYEFEVRVKPGLRRFRHYLKSVERNIRENQPQLNHIEVALFVLDAVAHWSEETERVLSGGATDPLIMPTPLPVEWTESE